MTLSVSLDHLLAYTEWERDTWYAWFPRQRAGAFTTSFGPNGDGRFSTVADVVRHIFSSEKRYIDRLSRRTVTDPASIPAEFPALFEFGREARKDLLKFLADFPAERWDVAEDHMILGPPPLRLTPRKIVVHVVLHEIRHWAQIATTARLQGLKVEPHDFLFSPILGGGLQR